MRPETVIVIPARYASTRFPGKPLVKVSGEPMIVRVWKQAMKCRLADSVIIATDDHRIESVAAAAGADVVMTASELPSGSDRVCAAVINRLAEIIVNLQGDEPLINPAHVDQAIDLLLQHPECDVSTLATPIDDENDLWNPNAVKVLIDAHDTAIYFSRGPVPFPRKTENIHVSSYFRHVGLYVYRRSYLEKFITWDQAPAEQIEQLEQLRVLHHGGRIAVKIVDQVYPGVDTPEDLDIIEQLMSRKGFIQN